MADRIVYSTDAAFCAACGRSPCACSDPSSARLRQREPVRLSFRRGAKGSGMTLVERLILNPQGKLELLRDLKKRLGCGGSIEEGALKLQGDHRDAAESELRARGYRVRRIGG